MKLSPLQVARYQYSPKLPGMLRNGISDICVCSGGATESVADQEKIKALFPNTYGKNEITYPSEEQLANGQIFQSLGEEATQEMNRLWLEVKASDASTTVYLILTGATVASIIPWALLRLRRLRRRRRTGFTASVRTPTISAATALRGT